MWVVHESEMRRYKVPSESRQGSPPVSVLALESPESDQHQISPPIVSTPESNIEVWE